MDSPLFKRRFEEETNDLLVSRTIYVFFIASILYPCFSGLDWLTKPDLALFFFYIRLLVSANFIVGVLLLKTDFGRQYATPISIWGGYVSILGVIIMTTYLGGFLSHYYIGIVLILFVPGLFLPWDLCSTLIFGLTSIFTYMAFNFTVGFGPDMNLMMAAGPFFFMTWSVAFMAFANVEKEKTRRRNLLLRMQIEMSNEDLKELDKTKMRFFSNVSHELRTPLTMIIGPLEQLIQNQADDNARPVLKAMEANAHRLLRQVNTILDFAKADAGKLVCHYKKSNLGKILSQLVQATRPYSEQKNITLTLSGTDRITDSMLDTEKVETIAANLISNALKFTPRRGTVRINAGVLAKHVWFEVQDTGQGIPENKLKDIFERFHQVDDEHSRKNEGTGLGLAMVKELVSLHAGEITVHSTLGEGSVFRVQLPVEPSSVIIDRRKTPGRRRSDRVSEARLDGLITMEYERRINTNAKTLLADVVNDTGLSESTPAHNFEDNQQAPIDAPKILIVEDNADLRAFIVSNLAGTYNVTQASNGFEGLELARRVNPNLIISDVMMPKMDGYELCRQIREDSFLSKIPIILVTAKSGGEAVEAGFEIGANDFISKPFEMRELKARITTHLNSRQLEKNINERDTRLTAIGQMTSSVVHDLRNPLNSLLGFTQLTQQYSREIEDEQILSNLERIMDSGNRLNRMINEILEFARDNVQTLDSEPTPLAPFLESALDTHKNLLSGLDIALESEYQHGDEIKVIMDADQIHRVIDNLIKNAKESFFTHTHVVEEKKIRITSRFDKDWAFVRFSDSGPGIPDQIKNSLFVPFTTSGKKSGTGLGLATVRNIMNAHSGDISVESHGPDGGAVFELKFPAKKSLR